MAFGENKNRKIKASAQCCHVKETNKSPKEEGFGADKNAKGTKRMASVSAFDQRAKGVRGTDSWPAQQDTFLCIFGPRSGAPSSSHNSIDSCGGGGGK